MEKQFLNRETFSEETIFKICKTLIKKAGLVIDRLVKDNASYEDIDQDEFRLRNVPLLSGRLVNVFVEHKVIVVEDSRIKTAKNIIHISCIKGKILDVVVYEDTIPLEVIERIEYYKKIHKRE